MRKTVKKWWTKLRDADVSKRQATALAVASGALLAGLIVVWLTMSTRTALLDRQLEQLDSRQTNLTDQINQTWTQIGNVTSPRAMEERAKRLGYKPPDNIEYLVTTPDATVAMTVTAVVTTTTTPSRT